MYKICLSFLLIFHCLTGKEITISLSRKTDQPINPIRQILRQVPQVNKERASQGLPSVINLCIGQPHVRTNLAVFEDLIDYLQTLNAYSDEQLADLFGCSHSSGFAETRNWIARFFNDCYPETKEFGGFSPEETMITNGASGAITNVLNVLIEKNDIVIVSSPYYAAYKSKVSTAGGILVNLPEQSSWAQGLYEALHLHPKAKLFIWNDPSNPAGTKASIEELEDIAKVLRKYPNLIILHDEVYKDITRKGHWLSLLNIAPDLKCRSIIIRSLSKDILGAPGVRAGMVAAPTKGLFTPQGEQINLLELLSNAQLRDIASINVFTQKILCFSLKHKLSKQSELWEKNMRSTYEASTKLMADELAKVNLFPLYTPNGAFYLILNGEKYIGANIPDSIETNQVKLSNLHQKLNTAVIRDDADLATFFLHIAGVAIVPASGFGIEKKKGACRISCAKNPQDLALAARRLGQACEFLTFD